MAIQSDDLRFTTIDRVALGAGQRQVTAVMVVPGGETYDSGAAGGIPINRRTLGFRASMKSFFLQDDGNVGYEYKFNPTTQRLRVFVPALQLTNTSTDVYNVSSGDGNFRALLDHAGAASGAFIATGDFNDTYLMREMSELVTGDAITSITADIVAVGY